MIPRRTLLNVVTFLVISGFLIYFGTTRFLFPADGGRTVRIETVNAAGLLPRADVTVRGVPSGSVRDVVLTERGTAIVTVTLDPAVTIPRGTEADITRRSPIGDITVDLVPGEGPPMANGGMIPINDVTTPPDPIETIRSLSEFLGAVTPEDLDTVVTELATGLRGRGRDLATLAEAGADLSERILLVQAELESMIERGPKVLDVLARNAPVVADDIVQTALLADILRDRRFDLVELMENGADFAEVFGEILATEKPNISCLVRDFGHVNATLARGENLENLKSSLDLNHFFFGAVEQSVLRGKDGYDWFRVHFLTPQQPPGRSYRRPAPDVFLASGCTSRYGPGVSMRIDHAPYVAPQSELHRQA
jgi:phospholipid/cholesterol/gamma-HCH transport system substrate-binding protein